MRIVLPLLIAAGLAGCVGMGMGGLNADQINAAVKDKSSAAGCSTYTGTGGQFQIMFVNLDKTMNTGGGEATVECGAAKVTFRDAGRAPKPVVSEKEKAP